MIGIGSPPWDTPLGQFERVGGVLLKALNTRDGG
ncbi:MAG: hypothetical protein CM15mP84_10520 [Cellvibrionales bacterium]|nr:MAG: hypothetical protein CM15mP84_10520 [Cellvibrionales bacterium]